MSDTFYNAPVNARLGIVGLEPPTSVDADHALEYLIGEAATLKLDIVGGDHRPRFEWGTFRVDTGYWDHLRAMASERGVEIEPIVRSPFDLLSGGAEARAATLASIQAAKHLGGPVMRSGYGRNTVATSRYSDVPLREHLAEITANLRLAVELAESAGVVLAIENHCDFTGRELAQVIEEVGSPSVRAALDTGNGMAIFCDPMDDAETLAPLTLTTHIKDLTVLDGPPLQPFRMIGCPIGEGVLNIATVIELVVQRGPRGEATPLIVEPGWPPFKEGDDRRRVRYDMALRSVDNLRRMVAKMLAT